MSQILVHQSDLAAMNRCMAEHGYKLAGYPDQTNSAAAYGTVIHHCLHVLERDRHEGVPFEEYVRKAIETFAYYWNPRNIEAITTPVPPDGWLPRQGYAELRSKGIEALRKYADLIRFDDHELLAIEYGFVVPIMGTWDPDLERPHELAGTVDRLAIRHYLSQPVVAVDDWKTGKKGTRLRHNLQFTGYCYATTRPEFWLGWEGEDGFGLTRGEELYTRTKTWARRGTWINMRTFKFDDAGFRAQLDYDRFALAINQYAALIRADIFPLTLSGEVCAYCDFRKICGGRGIADDDDGKPLPGRTQRSVGAR